MNHPLFSIFIILFIKADPIVFVDQDVGITILRHKLTIQMIHYNSVRIIEICHSSAIQCFYYNLSREGHRIVVNQVNHYNCVRIAKMCYLMILFPSKLTAIHQQ